MRYLVSIVLSTSILFSAGCATRVNAPDETSLEHISTEQSDIRPADGVIPGQIITESSVVYYPAAENTFGYIARPEGDGPFPALVLVHEWWGLNENIQEFADKFAKEGYVALTVDMYAGKLATTPQEAMQYSAVVRENIEPAFANLNAAVAYLKSQPYVDTDRVGSVGWCFGGGWAYQMAKNDLGVNASIMYYGQFEPAADFMHMKASILGHFGEDDTMIPVDDVETFRANLATASGDHAVYIYPNAGHAFSNEESAAYNKEAAELSWTRTLSFLEEEL